MFNLKENTFETQKVFTLLLKGKKMKVLSAFTHPNVISNLCDFFSSV